MTSSETTQKKVLQAINDISESNPGRTATTHDVAEALNLELYEVEHHFNSLINERLIKSYVKANLLSESSSSVVEITPKGKVVLIYPEELDSKETQHKILQFVNNSSESKPLGTASRQEVIENLKLKSCIVDYHLDELIKKGLLNSCGGPRKLLSEDSLLIVELTPTGKFTLTNPDSLG